MKTVLALLLLTPCICPAATVSLELPHVPGLTADIYFALSGSWMDSDDVALATNGDWIERNASWGRTRWVPNAGLLIDFGAPEAAFRPPSIGIYGLTEIRQIAPGRYRMTFTTTIDGVAARVEFVVEVGADGRMRFLAVDDRAVLSTESVYVRVDGPSRETVRITTLAK